MLQPLPASQQSAQAQPKRTRHGHFSMVTGRPEKGPPEAKKLSASPASMTTATIKLGQIAHARSGDKGNHANIGVVAYSRAGFEWLRSELTVERVMKFFDRLGTTSIERFELPRVRALNFLLYNALGGGASRSLRIDSQGKLLGTAILELPLPAPPHLSDMLAPQDA